MTDPRCSPKRAMTSLRDIAETIFGDFDIFDEHDSWEGHANVLVTDIEVVRRFEGSGTYRATLLHGGLCSARNLKTNDHSGIEWKTGPQVTVESNVDLSPFLLSGQKVLLFHASLQFDGRYIVVVNSTAGDVRRWSDRLPNGENLAYIDYFCGGIGGWGLASSYLTEKGWKIQQMAALDTIVIAQWTCIDAITVDFPSHM